MSINYYSSGFNHENAFWSELAEQLKKDIKETNRIIYIPGGNSEKSVNKALNKYIPSFTEHFKKIGIEFENVECITPEMSEENAKELVLNSNMVFLMGGDPFSQKELFSSKGLVPILENYDGVIFGMSAGAMNMSKNIIITPMGEEYPNFDIREGLGLSEFSFYPHFNFEGTIVPEKIVLSPDETIISDDLLKVAKEHGTFYCLQDYNGVDVSVVRTYGDETQIFTNNNGKVWQVDFNGFEITDTLDKTIKKNRMYL